MITNWPLVFYTVFSQFATGLAITLSKKLEMPELTQQLELKLEREKRRKAKKLAGKNKANNTRRGK